MGVLQALEAIKVLTAPDLDTVDGAKPRDPPALQIFSAFSNPQFRSIRLRSRRANCAVCSAEATVTLDTIASGSMDYVFFCGSAAAPSLLGPEERVSPGEYLAKHPLAGTQTHGEPGSSHTVIDVRDKAQFGICNLENSINIPISNFLGSAAVSIAPKDPDSGASQLPPWLPSELALPESNDPIYVVCRLGNDSQIAVKKMKELGLDRNGARYIGDIRGGFRAWREQVDPQWPEY
jgi:adenylyltransferase/sulfurtransferase